MLCHTVYACSVPYVLAIPYSILSLYGIFFIVPYPHIIPYSVLFLAVRYAHVMPYGVLVLSPVSMLYRTVPPHYIASTVFFVQVRTQQYSLDLAPHTEYLIIVLAECRPDHTLTPLM